MANELHCSNNKFFVRRAKCQSFNRDSEEIAENSLLAGITIAEERHSTG